MLMLYFQFLGIGRLAGLQDCWKRPETNELIEFYTVITMTANAFMQPLHDRMQVVLGDSDWAAVMNPEMNHFPLLQSMHAAML